MGKEQTEQVISEQPEMLQGEDNGSHKEPAGAELPLATLAALGVVYGDIGTSPLYALRKCFHGDHAVSASGPNVLGLLSLIAWSLMIVVSVKYMVYVLRADNRGEGGILALMALAVPGGATGAKGRWLLVAVGVFGAALLYGDGMITPAISVLSAVEGVELATPAMDPYVVPVTVTILLLLFLFQHRGTRRVGLAFGPLMAVWFLGIAALGIAGIVREPGVLAALSPVFAARFFLQNGWAGLMVLGAVFLVVTGGEALYADIGHFGRRPIRVAWFSLVLPALLLNYFGQGALLLRNPAEASQPFYLLAPGWALYPLLVLATAATVIASQAIISGAFSLTRQAVLLGHLPRVRIVQTSSKEIGQIYIPVVNWLLMLATILLVVGFRRSTNLAAAYGVAVSTTMVITTILAYRVTRDRWHWSPWIALPVTAMLLVVDLAFFGTNMVKIEQGGWVPLLVGGVVFAMMSTWKRGRTMLAEAVENRCEPLGQFVQRVARKPPVRVPGTAVFMTDHRTSAPLILLRHLEHNQVLHEQVVVLTVVVEEVPRVASADRLEAVGLGLGFFRAVARYGFMQTPDVPAALRRGRKSGLELNPKQVTYFVGRSRPILVDHRGMALWRERLFALLARNAADPVAFYGLPPERVMELGVQIKLQERATGQGE
jgi:KUP system potassium uptake protein